MGFMDNFTSDAPVEVKQPDYYSMMKEAAKAELLMNAVKCGVPTFYINEIATGKIETPEYTEELSVEMETEEPEAWGSIATAVKSILDEWSNESQVEDMARSIHAAVEVSKDTRIKEIRMKQCEEWARENEKKTTATWSCRTCVNNQMRGTFTAGECETCEDGSHYEEKESGETENGNE